MVFELFIIRPNWSNTSSNILLYSFSVQNNMSNIKIWFCVRYLRFLYFAVFIGHPTGAKQTAAGRRRLTNRLWPAAVDHVPPSASYHQLRSMVGGGEWWHSWQGQIKRRIQWLFQHSCRPFSAHFACCALRRLSKKNDCYGKSCFLFYIKNSYVLNH